MSAIDKFTEAFGKALDFAAILLGTAFPIIGAIALLVVVLAGLAFGLALVARWIDGRVR